MIFECVEKLLGLPLDEALGILLQSGIKPQIVTTKAPRRNEEGGAFRVVQVRDGGQVLVVCAFLTEQRG